jgi:hypothetical protein
METPPKKKKKKVSFSSTTPPPLLKKSQPDPSDHIHQLKKILQDSHLTIINIVQSPLYNKSRNYSFKAKCNHCNEEFFIKEGGYTEVKTYEHIQRNRKYNHQIKVPDFRGTIDLPTRGKVLLVFGWIDMSEYIKAESIEQESKLYDKLQKAMKIKQNDRDGTNVMNHVKGQHSLYYDFEDVTIDKS